MEAENEDFRRYLSAHHHRIEAFQTVATEVQNEIDCTACANCCRFSIVAVTNADIDALAAHLQMDPVLVTELYTIPDPESAEKRILQSTKDGCTFLDDNLCMVYEARPKACREFPHAAQGVHSLGGRFSSMCRWASLCPIIYNALERYKHLVGYRYGKRTGPR